MNQGVYFIVCNIWLASYFITHHLGNVRYVCLFLAVISFLATVFHKKKGTKK